MPNLCHFCHKSQTSLLYPPTQKEDIKNPGLFTCTNCGFGIHGLIVKCPACQIIYVDEKIPQSQISTYYEVAKDPLYFAEQSARGKTFTRYLHRLNIIFPKKGKILDIGTNTGLFVKLAKDDGWDAIGLEPNKWAVGYARKNYGISIINKPFEKNVFPESGFDVVTMWDVIEHFTDPVSEIKKVYWYLKSGGLFAFSTTDPESFLAKVMGTRWSWYMEMHRVFFSHFAAKKYLEKTGFQKIIFKPHFRYLSLGYLATRFAAINPKVANILHQIFISTRIAGQIVPYYANDLYDCYAFK